VRSRSIIIGAAFLLTILFLVCFGTLPSFRSDLQSTPQTVEERVRQMIDSNGDFILSFPEYRRALKRIITGVFSKQYSFNIDGNTVVDSNDLSRAVNAMRYLLSCGDGSVNAPESCDDSNTLSGDGCSATCITEEVQASSSEAATIGTCTLVSADHLTAEVKNLTREQCIAEQARWCPSHIDATVLYSEVGWGGSIPLYCNGPVRSCNIITARTGPNVSGFFETATHPDACITKHRLMCAGVTFAGKPVEFDGKIIAICQATSNFCSDDDTEKYINFPGQIDTERTYYPIIPSSNPPVTSHQSTTDQCVISVSGISSSCSGPYCFVQQKQCLGQLVSSLPSFAVQPISPLVPCFSGCSDGYCRVALGAYSADPFVSQFTCTLEPVSNGYDALSTRLNHAENLITTNQSASATECIKFAAVRYGARTKLLDALIARSVPRDLVEQIAAHQLLQTKWGYNLPSSTNEVWNRDDAVHFLEASDSLFSRRILDVYHRFGQ
jgi:cysteine-rich repeat protein